MKPDRVVIGSNNAKAREVLRHLYAAFVRATTASTPWTPRSAELTKYAANALLATRISFMNDLAMLAEKLGADIELVRKGVGADPRIGPKFLFPAPASAAPASPRTSPPSSSPPTRSATTSPSSAPPRRSTSPEEGPRRQDRQALRRLLAGRKVAVWGLAFKPQTDDIRESPALTLLDDLLAAGATVHAHDPQAMPNVKAIYGDRVTFCEQMYAAAEGADALALVTEWHEYRTPDFHRLLKLLKQPALFDGRNMWVPDEVRELGSRMRGSGGPERSRAGRGAPGRGGKPACGRV